MRDPVKAPIATPMSRNPKVSDVPPKTLFAIAGIRTIAGKAKKPVIAISIRRYLLGAKLLAMRKPSTASFIGSLLPPSARPIGGSFISIFLSANRVEEYAMPLSIKHTPSPTACITKPATVGPNILAKLKFVEFKATAFVMSSFLSTR